MSALARMQERLPGPLRKCGRGWRTNCPACGDRKGALSLTEADNGALLLKCFKGCAATDVVASVGLTLADLFPERLTPQTPQERREARRHAREAGWAAALNVLAFEASVVLIAARQLLTWQPLSPEDDARLVVALDRINSARSVLNHGHYV